jgi:hypothetical protein
LNSTIGYNTYPIRFRCWASFNQISALWVYFGAWRSSALKFLLSRIANARVRRFLFSHMAITRAQVPVFPCGDQAVRPRKPNARAQVPVFRRESPGEPGRAQESPGDPRRAQESPGEPRRAQESPGEPRRAQESPGEPRRAQESPGEPRKAQESPGEHKGAQIAQESSGEPRRAQESPRKPRRAQESPGKPKRAVGNPRTPQVVQWLPSMFNDFH